MLNQVLKVFTGIRQHFVEMLSKSVTFLDFWLSQSSAATYCRWDGSLCNVYIENFLTNHLVKEFWKWSTFAKVIIKHQEAWFFGARCSSINSSSTATVWGKHFTVLMNFSVRRSNWVLFWYFWHNTHTLINLQKKCNRTAHPSWWVFLPYLVKCSLCLPVHKDSSSSSSNKVHPSMSGVSRTGQCCVISRLMSVTKRRPRKFVASCSQLFCSSVTHDTKRHDLARTCV